MSDTNASLAARMRRYFTEATASTKIGGATVLQELSNLASACINGMSPAQDAMSFALFTIFGQHAEDRDERLVTGDDTYRLLASGLDHLSDAIKFVEEGGGSDDAVRIIAALARLTPDRLYGRWPPEIPK